MPLTETLTGRVLLRLPGATALAATAWTAATLTDPLLQVAASVTLASLGGIGLLAQFPRPGRRPVVGDGTPGAGSLLVGHTRADRLGGAVSIPWSTIDGGLSVTGPAPARSAFLAGLALQSIATGRCTIVLDLGIRGDAFGETFRVAARQAGLSRDLRIMGEEGEGNGLSPFGGLSPSALQELIAVSCPALSGDDQAAVHARLLLPAATAFYGHLVKNGLAYPVPAAFEDCIRLRRLGEAVTRDYHPDMTDSVAAEIRGYLGILPGWVAPGDGKQPTSLVALHTAAEMILRDGLRIIHRACGATNPNSPATDLVSAGRATVIRQPVHPRRWQEAGFVADLIRILLAEKGKARPLIIVDGVDALPPALVERIAALRGVGATLAIGTGSGSPRAPGVADLVTGASVRIGLSRLVEGPASIQVSGSGAVGAFPLAMSNPSRWSWDRETPRRRVRVIPPDPGDTLARDMPIVMSRLLDGIPPGFAVSPDPVIDSLARRLGGGAGSVGTLEAAMAVADAALVIKAEAGEGDTRATRRAGRRPDPVEDTFGIDEMIARMKRGGDPQDCPFGEFDDINFDLDPNIGLGSPFDFDFEAAPALDPASLGTSPDTHVVFPASIRSDAGLAEGGWHRVAGKALHLAPMTEPDVISTMLDLEFPHMAKVTAGILGAMPAVGPVRMRPLLLAGPQGVGKTRYARRLCEFLSVHCSNYPCSGASDSSFIGAARQWSGARAGYVPALLARQRVANPCIVLDGIDAVTEGGGNGSLFDALPGLLDAETASRYHDPYLDTPIDVSSMLWIATARDVSKLPPGFLDYFRVEAVPMPTREHRDALVCSILSEFGNGSEQWFEPDEWQAVSRVVGSKWKGGSIRPLRALVEEAATARARAPGKAEA